MKITGLNRDLHDYGEKIFHFLDGDSRHLSRALHQSRQQDHPFISNFAKQGTVPKIHRLFLATKVHKGAQRKKQYLYHPNEKLLEVQKPFLEKVFGRRRQKWRWI